MELQPQFLPKTLSNPAVHSYATNATSSTGRFALHLPTHPSQHPNHPSPPLVQQPAPVLVSTSSSVTTAPIKSGERKDSRGESKWRMIGPFGVVVLLSLITAVITVATIVEGDFKESTPNAAIVLPSVLAFVDLVMLIALIVTRSKAGFLLSFLPCISMLTTCALLILHYAHLIEKDEPFQDHVFLLVFTAVLAGSGVGSAFAMVWFRIFYSYLVVMEVAG